jgi:hypothetical protein
LTGWKDIFCLDTLAAAYAETGDFESALKWQNEAIRLHPDGPGLTGLGEFGEGDFQCHRALYLSKKSCRE